MNGLTVFISIVAMASTASSLRCYDCGSDLEITNKTSISSSGYDCITSVNNHGEVKECDDDQSACANVTLLPTTLDGTIMTVRGCMQMGALYAGKCIKHEGDDGMKYKQCFCLDDFCNDAPRAMKVSFRALLMALAFPLMTLALI